MSAIPHAPERLWARVDGPYRLLPVFHERLEFADLVRVAFEVDPPDAVVVELPLGLQRPWTRAVGRLPQLSAIYLTPPGKKTRYWICQPADAFAEASRQAAERGIPLVCGDLDVDDYGAWRDRVPDAYALWRVGPHAMTEAYLSVAHPRDDADDARERALAFAARKLHEEGRERIAIVCGIHHLDGVARALGSPQAEPLAPRSADARVVHLHPEGLDEILADPPFYLAAYEARRRGVPETTERALPGGDRRIGPFRLLEGGGPTGDSVAEAAARAAAASCHDLPRDSSLPTGPIERLRLQWNLLREAERALAAHAPDAEVRDWQRRNLATYARNLARLSGRLVVDLYDLIVACRGCANELYAYEVLQLARAYPLQQDSSAGLATAKISAEDLFDGVRRLRLVPHRRREKRGDWWNRLAKGRRRPDFSGEWLLGFDDEGICSYPPEDEVIETFGHFLRRKGKTLLQEEQARVVPFSTSLLDGIDVRETIRRWHEGRLWVRELGRVPGGVDSVVVVFDEDTDAERERFPYCQTWLGEHDQESDMAFYSTEPAEGVVGPGICRVTYGGLALCMPPRRMRDVWSDPDYRGAESKPEILLMAALDYARENTVVYAAPRAPRARMFRLAARFGLRILYVPLGSLAPSTLRKIRVMHILAGRSKRSIAGDYIW